MVFFPVIFHRERKGRGDGIWVLWREVHGPRADDHVALRRPAGRQVPEH